MDYDFLSEFENDEGEFLCEDVDEMNSLSAMDLIELELDLEDF